MPGAEAVDVIRELQGQQELGDQVAAETVQLPAVDLPVPQTLVVVVGVLL
jgi:hypothetical protein